MKSPKGNIETVVCLSAEVSGVIFNIKHTLNLKII